MKREKRKELLLQCQRRSVFGCNCCITLSLLPQLLSIRATEDGFSERSSTDDGTSSSFDVCTEGDKKSPMYFGLKSCSALIDCAHTVCWSYRAVVMKEKITNCKSTATADNKN